MFLCGHELVIGRYSLELILLIHEDILSKSIHVKPMKPSPSVVWARREVIMVFSAVVRTRNRLGV